MTADLPSPPAEPRSIRLATCALGGAFAGLVLGVWGVVFALAFNYWDRGMAIPLLHFIEEEFMLRAGEYLQPCMGAAMPGVTGGLLSSLFSRRLRHPMALASLWALIPGVPGSVFALMMTWDDVLAKQHPGETLLMLALFPTTGALYGFTLGLAARLLERGWQRLRGRASA